MPALGDVHIAHASAEYIICAVCWALMFVTGQVLSAARHRLLRKLKTFFDYRASFCVAFFCFSVAALLSFVLLLLSHYRSLANTQNLSATKRHTKLLTVCKAATLQQKTQHKGKPRSHKAIRHACRSGHWACKCILPSSNAARVTSKCMILEHLAAPGCCATVRALPTLLPAGCAASPLHCCIAYLTA